MSEEAALDWQEILPKLEPVVRAPNPGRIGGFGIGLRGRLQPDANDPKIFFILTVLILFYFPVFPLSIYLCQRTKRGYLFQGRIGWRKLAALCGWPSTLLFAAGAFSFTLFLIALLIGLVVYIKVCGPDALG